jgi:hypothetical protein
MSGFNAKYRHSVFALIGASLALSSSFAAADGIRCKPIRGTGHLPVFQLPCEKDPSYFACSLGTVEGTLKGKWHAFFKQPGTVINGMDLQIPPEAPTSYYNSEIDVLRTSEGKIYSYSHYVFDDTTWVDGGFTATLWIIGGTGIYRKATGWLVNVAKDAANVDYFLYGKVCGPHIPG